MDSELSELLGIRLQPEEIIPEDISLKVMLEV